MKETLEEAAFRLYPKYISDPYNPSEDLNKYERDIWIQGAKWQQEQAKEIHKADCINFSIEWENRRDDEDIKSKEDLYDLIYKK